MSSRHYRFNTRKGAELFVSAKYTPTKRVQKLFQKRGKCTRNGVSRRDSSARNRSVLDSSSFPHEAGWVFLRRIVCNIGHFFKKYRVSLEVTTIRRNLVSQSVDNFTSERIKYFSRDRGRDHLQLID